MSETPETDEEEFLLGSAHAQKLAPAGRTGIGVVPSKFARSLEKRLRQAEADLEKARDTALEDAAKVCRDLIQPIECRADRMAHEICNAVRSECAAAIRAMRGKP